MKILFVNGPNLNRLGKREPQIYGATSLEEVENRCRALCTSLNMELIAFQSNHEGALIDFIQRYQDEALAMLINPAGYGHTSVALRDAVIGSGLYCVEVHISNIAKRESFRHKTLLGDVVQGSIVGLGVYGYELGILAIHQHLMGG